MKTQQIRFYNQIKDLKQRKRIKDLENELSKYKEISNFIIDNGIHSSQDVGEKWMVEEFDEKVIEKLWNLGVNNE